MPVVKRTEVMPYSAAQMYALVNDIENYPQFLPWCSRAEVLSRDDDEVRATLELSKGGLSKEFTTCNRLQKDKMIEVRLVSGPFKHLDGFWHFESLADGQSRVSLHLDFEFPTRILAFMVGPVFHQVANTLVDSFCQRAHELYQSQGESAHAD